MFDFDALKDELEKITAFPSRSPCTRLLPTEPLDWLDAMQKGAKYDTRRKSPLPYNNDGAHSSRLKYYDGPRNGGCGRQFGYEASYGIRLISGYESSPEINDKKARENRAPSNFGVVAQPTSASQKKSFNKLAGEKRSDITGGKRGALPNFGMVTRSASPSQKKLPSKPIRKSYFDAASGKQKASLERDTIEHGRSKTLTVIPAQGKVPKKRYNFIPLLGAFSEDLTLKISGGVELKMVSKDGWLQITFKNGRLRLFGNSKLRAYLVYAGNRALRMHSNDSYKAKGVRYVICANRGMKQEEIARQKSLLEIENEYLLREWLDPSILGVAKIRESGNQLPRSTVSQS
jgi:hypothetical protein